jgi:hypothetical protein
MRVRKWMLWCAASVLFFASIGLGVYWRTMPVPSGQVLLLGKVLGAMALVMLLGLGMHASFMDMLGPDDAEKREEKGDEERK